MTVKADWFTDPLGSSDLRYFNGQCWTEHVITNGEQSTDTLNTEGLADPVDLSDLPPPPQLPGAPQGSLDSTDLMALPPPPTSASTVVGSLEWQVVRQEQKEAKRLAKEEKLAQKAAKQQIEFAEIAKRKEQEAKAAAIALAESQASAAIAEKFKIENDARKKALRDYKRASSSFKGVTVTPDRLTYRGAKYPLPGVRASVETAGDIQKRSTVTRYAVLGPLAGIAFKKSKDNRELYLTVEGEGFAFVVNLDPDTGSTARQFAAIINTAGMKAAAVTSENSATSGSPEVLHESNSKTATSQDRDDFVEGLERLHKLFESGALNDEEYELAKMRILADDD